MKRKQIPTEKVRQGNTVLNGKDKHKNECKGKKKDERKSDKKKNYKN